jgi:multidrug efflux pump subunit AcrA (membrane-fusion protein)
MEKEDIKLRSDDVQEILSKVPSWMVRWGTTLIFVLITLLIVLSYVIKYPDTIPGKVRITAVHSPVTLNAPNGGIIQELIVEDGNQVEKGNPIAILKNPIDQSDIILLDSLIARTYKSVADSSDFIHMNSDSLPDYGALQEKVNKLGYLIDEYNSMQGEKGLYNLSKIKNLKEQYIYYDRMRVVQTRQIKIAQEEYKNATEKRDGYKEMYQKGLVSKMEYIKEQSNFNAKKDRIEALKTEKLTNDLAAQKIEVELLDLEFKFNNEQRQIFEEINRQLNLLHSEIIEWKDVYVLEAAESGEVSYVKSVSEGEYIQPEKPLFAIIPSNKSKKGEITVSAAGLGKVQEGQRVIIELDEYPAHEYGQLNGEVVSVTKVSAVVKENQNSAAQYNVKVALADELKTTYNKPIKLDGELNGNAKIITHDRSILERVLSQFKDLFENY